MPQCTIKPNRCRRSAKSFKNHIPIRVVHLLVTMLSYTVKVHVCIIYASEIKFNFASDSSEYVGTCVQLVRVCNFTPRDVQNAKNVFLHF